MLHLIAISIDVFSTAIILVPVLIILFKKLFKIKSVPRILCIILFAFYITAVFSVVGIPTVTGITIDLGFNLIPLIDMINSPIDYLKNTILNIILFVPLGCLTPIIWKKFLSLKKMTILGFGLSLFIEIIQIFTFRLTDIDDLIMNTIGTVIGYFIAKVIWKRIKCVTVLSSDDMSNDNSQLYTVLATTFFVTFFIATFIASFIWSMTLFIYK